MFNSPIDKIMVNNKKDILFNDLVDWCKSEDLTWIPNEIQNGTAANAVHTLCDILWYLDGHHATLADWSSHVPSIFMKFAR